MTVLEPFEAAFSFTPVAKEERIVWKKKSGRTCVSETSGSEWAPW